MIFRILFWILLFFGLSWLLRRLFGSGAAGRRSVAGAGRPPATEPPRPGGKMVRDPVCNTYLPEDRALVERDPDGGIHHFCSTNCRDRFLEAAGRPSQDPQEP